MDTSALRSLFDDLRPRIPDRALYELATLLGNDTIRHGQAQWTDAHKEHGLEVDVFTDRHRFNVNIAVYPGPVIVSVTPLVFSRIRSEDDEHWVTVGDGDIRLCRSVNRAFGGQARVATDDPVLFLRWAVEHGTWAQRPVNAVDHPGETPPASSDASA